MEKDINKNTSPQTDGSEIEPKNKKQKEKSSRKAKIINIVTGVIIVLALVFTFESLYAKTHLHNNFFGYAILPVKTDSMKLENGGKDNFKSGDLIFVKILDEDEKRSLKVGDVITFKWFDMTDATEKLNTHRITKLQSGGYITQGDALPEAGVGGTKSSESVDYEDVVGVFKTKMVGIGNIGLILESKAGMFVVIVVPFLLLLALSVFYFIRNFKTYNKERAVEVAESTIATEKERLRLEILAELEKQKQTDEEKQNDVKDDSSV